jgi:hypothetical protein
MIYKQIISTVDAFTFDEVVQAGLQSGAALAHGRPEEFAFLGLHVHLEDPMTYSIAGMPMSVTDMLVSAAGRFFVIPAADFFAQFEPVHTPIPEAEPLDFAAGEIRATGTVGAPDGQA